ncbi:tripartite motif-containing protein 3-like [Ptychodera flava]|uniref:tripartite motif-containing protein 3-like n=1 Tax=Ptychodera flava TaxID=63121 RepID=UPI00396A57F3
MRTTTTLGEERQHNVRPDMTEVRSTTLRNNKMASNVIHTTPKSRTRNQWINIGRISNDETEDDICDIPRGLAVDKEGKLVVTDGLRRIQKLNFRNFERTTIVCETLNAQKVFPLHIAVSKDNHYFVTDFQSQDVFICDSDGRLVKYFQTKSLADPMGIAINTTTNIVYVANKGKHTVSMFTSDGDYIKSFDQKVPENSQLLNPYGIAVDHKWNVVVSDRSQHRIQVFDASFNPLFTFGSRGSTPGLLHHPEGIAVDKEDSIYVCDNGNDRVQKFSSNGGFICCINGAYPLKNPKGVAIDDEENRVFVAAFNAIYIYECATT